MKVVAIIQARLHSTRLPGKVLREINGKPMLEHVIDRLRETSRVDQIVAAIPATDTELADWCLDYWGFPCYTHDGDENDVLGRMVGAAKMFDANLIVRVCADNPRLNPAGVDELIGDMSYDVDYAAFEIHRGRPVISYPTGYFAEVVTRDALIRADRMATTPYDREHVTSVIYCNQDRFVCRWLPLPRWYRVNAAVDTEEDLQRVAGLMRQQNPSSCEVIR